MPDKEHLQLNEKSINELYTILSQSVSIPSFKFSKSTLYRVIAQYQKQKNRN
jgi:hypothetical protein